MPYDRVDRVGSPLCCWGLLGYLGVAVPGNERQVKRIVLFAVRIGFLPHQRWFYGLVMKHLWRPAAVRDAGEITGWIEMSWNTSPKTIANFRAWWISYAEPLQIAGDRAE